MIDGFCRRPTDMRKRHLVRFVQLCVWRRHPIFVRCLTLIIVDSALIKIFDQLERRLVRDLHTMRHLFWRNRAVLPPILRVMDLGLCVVQYQLQTLQPELCAIAHDIRIVIDWLLVQFWARHHQRTVLCILFECLTFFILFCDFLLEIIFVKIYNN